MVLPTLMTEKEAYTNLANKMCNLAEYWREQAELFANQEKQWHEVAEFCCKLGRDLENKYR